MRIDKTSNNNNAQVQSDYFTGIAQPVPITVTGMPSGTNAGFYEFKVFGDPSNLALSKTASADSAQTANPASKGNDGNYGTRWCANDGNTGHWWTVDLGSSMNITGGTQVKWEQNGVSYKYKIETSNDNINWTLKADKTASTSTDQFQSDPFYRYRPVCQNYRDRLANRSLGQLLGVQGNWVTKLISGFKGFKW